jgi:D-methionine transport system ATP-binding protein
MNLIEIKDLSKSFGKYNAIKNLHLTVPESSIYGIIGMSGAGKSTLLRCLTGLEMPTSGSIFIDGKLINKEHFPLLRQQMGMVFQHFQLFSSRSAAKNIAYPLEIRGIPQHQIHERVTELLDLVGLTHKKDHYPNQLSGGEKQRVGIARALAHHPRLLLCDEPTSALDTKSTRSILQLLSSLNQKLGLTIILITHQLETVKQICQRVAVLSHGEIVEEGSVVDIFTNPRHTDTQQLLHLSIDQIPPELICQNNPSKKLIRLGFQGENAKQPIISQLIKNFDIEVNILGGGLDHLQQTIIGTLFVELSGNPDKIEQALEFLNRHKVVCEVLK